MDNSSLLLYKLYPSGVSNERMSLEVAVALAAITGRALVLYGDLSDNRQLKPTFGGRYQLKASGWYRRGLNLPEYKSTLITDLYECMPVDWSVGVCSRQIDSCDFDSEASDICVFREQLSNYCFWNGRFGSEIASFSSVEDFARHQFSDGRPIISFPSQRVWRLEGSNLSFYSRLIYDTSLKAKNAIERMRFKPWIRELSEKIGSRIGDKFNGCHIRLTDMLDFLPQSAGYGHAIAECLRSVLDSNQLLVVATDENPGHPFFLPIRKGFPRILFLDQFIRDECLDLWSEAPYFNESILGLVCQLILAKSSMFLGTPGSTFTGMIHRGWLQRHQLSHSSSVPTMRFVHSGLHGSPARVPGYFENGAYVETQQGMFSWNRIMIRSALKGQLAWYREWPEVLCAC